MNGKRGEDFLHHETYLILQLPAALILFIYFIDIYRYSPRPTIFTGSLNMGCDMAQFWL